MNIPPGLPRISEAQAEALFALSLNWPWGIDGRTARSMVKRRWTRPAVKAGPDGGPWVYQVLTRAGAAIAEQLKQANEFEWHKERREIEATWHRTFPETKIG